MTADVPFAPGSPVGSVSMWIDSFRRRINLFLRLSLLGFLVLLLQIPIERIESTVREREQTRNTAVQGITGVWGDRQTIVGPLLAVPYHVRSRNADNVEYRVPGTAYFLPESLGVTASLTTEKRYRGIFEVPVYQAKLHVTGQMRTPDFSGWAVLPEDIAWDGAALVVGVTDPKAIRERVSVQWGEARLAFGPGRGPATFLPAGISVRVPGAGPAGPGASRTHAFSFDMVLGGSAELRVLPVGTETQVSISSDWADPSFVGSALPASRSVTPGGFSASWKLPDLGRNYPQRWRNDDVSTSALDGSAFGVSLLSPVDAYTATTRAVKYELLFVGLTFVAFYLIEIFYSLRIHPVQYLLVGFALCIFYLLLLALSEHIGFGPAYGIAAAAVVGLVGGYCLSILDRRRLALLVTAEIAGLYAFLFVLLRIQDYALLVGSVGVFLVLAGVMFVTRKVDWYQAGAAATH